MLLRIGAHGPVAYGSDAMNLFDAAVVAVSLVDIVEDRAAPRKRAQVGRGRRKEADEQVLVLIETALPAAEAEEHRVNTRGSAVDQWD